MKRIGLKILQLILGLLFLIAMIVCLVKFYIADEVLDKLNYGVGLIIGTIYLCRE